MNIWLIIVPILMAARVIIFSVIYKLDLKRRKYMYMTEAAVYYKKRYNTIKMFYTVLFLLEIHLIEYFFERIVENFNVVTNFLNNIIRNISNKTYGLIFKKYEPNYVEADYEK